MRAAEVTRAVEALGDGRIAAVADVAGAVELDVQALVGTDVDVAGAARGHARAVGLEPGQARVAGAVEVDRQLPRAAAERDVGRAVGADRERVRVDAGG